MAAIEILKHPLILLLIGAIITNYLIPRITRSWQDRQKDIEFKTELITALTDSVLKILTSVQYAELGAQSQTQEDYDNAYRTWEIERYRVEAKIHGYFPQSFLIDQWRTLSNVVIEIYSLSGTHNTTYRNNKIYFLKSNLQDFDVDWETLASIDMKTGGNTESINERFKKIQIYRHAWFQLKEAVLFLLSNIIESIVEIESAWIHPRKSRIFSFRQKKSKIDKKTLINKGASLIVPVASNTQVRSDIFGVNSPPDIDELDEMNVESIIGYARKWFNFGELRKALEAIDRAIQIESNNLKALKIRLFTLKNMKLYNRALEDNLRIVELDSENPDNWASLSEVYRKKGKLDDALEAINKAIVIEESELYWSFKALILDELNRKKDADLAYIKAKSSREKNKEFDEYDSYF